MSDPGLYGRSFADVYDDWYADVTDPALVVEALVALAEGGPVLELGIGTGRIALPLAARGLAVHGIDASPEMVALLREHACEEEIPVRLGDLGDPATYVGSGFSLAFCGFNTMFNLDGRGAQRACIASTAGALAPGGRLVVEAVVVNAPDRTERDLSVARVDEDRVVLVATETDPSTSTIVGQHIELRDGTVKLRPWRLHYLDTTELDELATEAGLTLEHRWADWDRSPFEPGGPRHITVYRSSF